MPRGITLEGKAEPINRDIAVFLGDLSPAQQSARFAEIAEEQIDEAKAINTAALHREPPSKTFVDGRLGAPLVSVRPVGGIIHVEFELLVEVLLFIARTLEAYSPVKTGRYKKSHMLFADGAEMDLETPALAPQLLKADEYVFVNSVPYARKIERGMSPEAPDGVYQATAVLARRQFSQIARITFSYRGIFGSGARAGRNPAVIVRAG